MSTSESIELPTFKKFLLLPGEIRELIYQFATPPRVVVVQEDPENFVKFRKRLARTWRDMELDPSLAHFAFVWSDWLEDEIPQRPQDIGGSGGTQATSPWTPSESTPELPMKWLARCPDLAYEFLRRGRLYSCTPIPALLHVCAESRKTLIRWGYSLAFRTRSSEPCTWFHFDHDILFLKQETTQMTTVYPDHSHYRSRILSGGPWAVGHFHPQDLCKVQNLALEDCATRLQDIYWPNQTFVFHREVSNLLRLFGNIRELQMVEWAGDSTKTYSELESPGNRNPATSQPEPPVVSIPVREEDALLQLFNDDLRERPGMCISASGPAGEVLRAYKQMEGLRATLLGACCERTTRFLTMERDRVMSSQKGSNATVWNIPKCSLVHVLSPAALEFVLGERKKMVEKLWKLKVWGSQKMMKEIRLVWEDARRFPRAIKNRTMLNAAKMLAKQDGDDDMGNTQRSGFTLHQQSLEIVEQIELDMLESLQKDKALLRKVNEVLGRRVSANSRKSTGDSSISSNQEMKNARTVQIDAEDVPEEDASEGDAPVSWLASDDQLLRAWARNQRSTRDEDALSQLYQMWLADEEASQELQYRGTREHPRFHYNYGLLAGIEDSLGILREWWGHEGWISALDEYEARSLANNSRSIEQDVLRTFRGLPWRRACSKNFEFCGRITGAWETTDWSSEHLANDLKDDRSEHLLRLWLPGW